MITKRGKRNQSSLMAHHGFIRDARNQNPPMSYAKICEHLLAQHNLEVAPSTVFNYVKVRSKKRSYYTMLEPASAPKEPETDHQAIRRAQLEEKKRVDQSRSENEALLKAKAASQKRTFAFDPAKPLELKTAQT